MREGDERCGERVALLGGAETVRVPQVRRGCPRAIVIRERDLQSDEKRGKNYGVALPKKPSDIQGTNAMIRTATMSAPIYGSIGATASSGFAFPMAQAL